VRTRSDELRVGFSAVGLNVGCSHDSAVVPWIVGDSAKAMAWSDRLGECGHVVQLREQNLSGSWASSRGEAGVEGPQLGGAAICHYRSVMAGCDFKRTSDEFQKPTS
jgi:hypothetical protein